MQALGRHARSLLAGWLDMRDGDALCPLKAALSPAAMMPTLGDMVVMEHQGADFWRVRLMGTNVVRRLGRDGTGANPLDLMPAADRCDLRDKLARVVGDPCAHLEDRLERLPDGDPVAVQLLRLPMLDSAGHCRFIVVSTEEGQAPQGGTGDRSDRFGDGGFQPASTFIPLTALERLIPARTTASPG